jgi:hypothetical protein
MKMIRPQSGGADSEFVGRLNPIAFFKKPTISFLGQAHEKGRRTEVRRQEAESLASEF